MMAKLTEDAVHVPEVAPGPDGEDQMQGYSSEAVLRELQWKAARECADGLQPFLQDWREV